MMGGSGCISFSAPGSLMIAGEHAVLHGQPAIVCAIDRRITVSLFPREDEGVRIESALGEYEAARQELREDERFRFVLHVLKQYVWFVPSGFTLKIDSQFSDKIGFGSSAAVTAAVTAVMMKFADGACDRHRVFERSLATIREVQGRGSGSDLAASVYGGTLRYKAVTREIDPLPLTGPLTAVYCGYKRRTPEVIAQVAECWKNDLAGLEKLYMEIGACVDAAAGALRGNNRAEFAAALKRNQELMDRLGVNTPELREIIGALNDDPGICGAKISGSGLGDCAVGIGRAESLGDGLAYPVYALEISPDGLRKETHD